MEAIDLAQALADYFNPPHLVSKIKHPLYINGVKRPFEERYEDVLVKSGPESQTYTVKRDTDGGPYIRALTYLEVAEAALKLQQEKENEKK